MTNTMRARRTLRLAFRCALCLALFAAAAGAQTERTDGARLKPLDHIVAIVGDDTISYAELREQVNLLRAQLDRGDEPPPSPDELEARVIEKMILDKLQLQEAERHGIQVDELALDRSMEALARRNEMSLDELRIATERSGLAYADLRERVRTQVISQRLIQQVVVNDITVTEEEIDAELKKRGIELAREYRLIQVNADAPTLQRLRADLADTARIDAPLLHRRLQRLHDEDGASDEGGEASETTAAPFRVRTMKWLAKDELPRSLRRRIDDMRVGTFGPPVKSARGTRMYFLLETRDNHPEDLVDDDNARTVYNTRHILVRPNVIDEPEIITRRLERMRRDIESGEREFADLARRYSEDPISRFKGGSLGWVSAEAMVPEFAEQMRQAPHGEVVGPFSSAFGVHLLQVLDARTESGSGDALREQIAGEIRRRKTPGEIRQWRIDLRNSSHVEVRLRTDTS